MKVFVLYWHSWYERSANVIGVYETLDQAEAVKSSQVPKAANVYRNFTIKEFRLQLAAPDSDTEQKPALLRRQAE